jgi:hypothetical protein
MWQNLVSRLAQVLYRMYSWSSIKQCHTWGLTPRLSGVSQICRKRVVSAVWSFISECTMPLPALRYCTLPRPRASCLTLHSLSSMQHKVEASQKSASLLTDH